MAIELKKYKTICFDCDGVILNSNAIKANVFYEAALPYGEVLAQALRRYHVLNGGISRYQKFDYFLKELVSQNMSGPGLEELLEKFGDLVREGLLTCEIAMGLYELKEKNRLSNWCVVSGGDQKELRDIFQTRGLSSLFDVGIFGSPETKEEILEHLIHINFLKNPALFLGDSLYDHVVAKKFGLDFIFVSDWTEFSDHKQYCENNNIPVIRNLNQLAS